jgi:TPR repeat protein
LRLARLENFLLVTAILVAAAAGVHEFISRSNSGGSKGGTENSEQTKTHASSDRSGFTEGEVGIQLAQTRAQLSQASEQLKASQDRVAQLEAQLKQAPALGAGAPSSSSDRVGTTSGEAAHSVPPSEPIQHSPLSAETLAQLARGDSLMGAGDVAAARLFYERAAAAGNGEAALRLGETYDLAFLRRIHAAIQGDHAQAAYWYRRAVELGQSEAETLLNDAQTK